MTVIVFVALAGEETTVTIGEAAAGTIIVEPLGAETPELKVTVEYTTTNVADPLTEDDGDDCPWKPVEPLGDGETVIVEPCSPFCPADGVTVQDTTTPNAGSILLVTVVGS